LSVAACGAGLLQGQPAAWPLDAAERRKTAVAAASSDFGKADEVRSIGFAFPPEWEFP
jgi:hypothetical protein